MIVGHQVEYHHVVFTLPAAVAEVVYQNQKLGYTLLFRAASETLKQIAADPKHLGAEIGVTAVLHTWGQTLTFHPHLHCLATGGGLTPEGLDRLMWGITGIRPANGHPSGT